MKIYLSVGIGDMVVLDSILTAQEKQNITEIYWGCRFGRHLIPLMESNPSYPNLRVQHVLNDAVGAKEMASL